MVFEPGVMTEGEIEREKQSENIKGRLKNVALISRTELLSTSCRQTTKPIPTISGRQSCSSSYRPQDGQSVSACGLTWPSCLCLLFYLRCSCLPISHCSPPVSKPPHPPNPTRCPDPDTLTLMHETRAWKEEREREKLWMCAGLFTSDSRLSAGWWW